MGEKLTDWQDIATAPKDGSPFRAEVEGYPGEYQIRWEWGFVDSDGKDCGGWAMDSEQEPPPCWSDGVCWDSNENEMPSAQPTRWAALSLSEGGK